MVFFRSFYYARRHYQKEAAKSLKKNYVKLRFHQKAPKGRKDAESWPSD